MAGRKRKVSAESMLSKMLTIRADQPAINARLVWEDGVPKLRGTPVYFADKQTLILKDVMKTCLDLPYDGPDPTLQGLPMGAAMIVSMTRLAADGDATARAELLDRLLGKAQQNVQSVNLSGTLSDFLDKVAVDLPPHAVNNAQTVVHPRDIPPETDELDDL